MCCILHRWTNDKNLYFYFPTVTIVHSSNTVRESSHISFFCGEGPCYEVVQRPEYTHDMFARLTRKSLPSLERLADLSSSLERSADLWLQSKITDLIFSLKSQAEIWTPSLPHVLSVYGLLSELCWYITTVLNLLSSSTAPRRLLSWYITNDDVPIVRKGLPVV